MTFFLNIGSQFLSTLYLAFMVVVPNRTAVAVASATLNLSRNSLKDVASSTLKIRYDK